MISRIYVMPRNESAQVDSYLIDSKLSKNQLEKLAQALTNPILENYFINTSPEISGFLHAIEIGYLPGVTDNVGHTVKEMAGDLFKLKKSAILEVYTSKIFFMSGTIKKSARICGLYV